MNNDLLYKNIWTKRKFHELMKLHIDVRIENCNLSSLFKLLIIESFSNPLERSCIGHIFTRSTNDAFQYKKNIIAGPLKL